MIQIHLLSVKMDDVYQNIDDSNPSRKRKILTMFDDMIADIMSNKKFPAIIKESPPGMRRRSDVSFWPHIGRYVADHA